MKEDKRYTFDAQRVTVWSVHMKSKLHARTHTYTHTMTEEEEGGQGGKGGGFSFLPFCLSSISSSFTFCMSSVHAAEDEPSVLSRAASSCVGSSKSLIVNTSPSKLSVVEKGEDEDQTGESGRGGGGGTL